MTTECRRSTVRVLDVRGIVRGQARSYHSTWVGRGNGIWLVIRRDRSGISVMNEYRIIA